MHRAEAGLTTHLRRGTPLRAVLLLARPYASRSKIATEIQESEFVEWRRPREVRPSSACPEECSTATGPTRGRATIRAAQHGGEAPLQRRRDLPPRPRRDLRREAARPPTNTTSGPSPPPLPLRRLDGPPRPTARDTDLDQAHRGPSTARIASSNATSPRRSVSVFSSPCTRETEPETRLSIGSAHAHVPLAERADHVAGRVPRD